MQAVIMAGGSGIRLRPFTYAIPKPLLPLGDLTILEYTIRSLSQAGFNEIFLLTSYQHEKFQQCREYENKYQIKINIDFEEERMGTAGGLILLKNRLDDNFLTLNGDILVRMSFRDMFDYHLSNQADMTIGITKFSFTVPYGVVELGRNHELINLTEKAGYSFLVSSGIYILNSSILGLMEHTDYLDMPELIAMARKKHKKLNTFDVGERWLDTGQLDDYERAVGKIEEWSQADSGEA